MASIKVCMTFSIESFTKGAVSNGTENAMPCGSTVESSFSRERTPSAVLTALAPGIS